MARPGAKVADKPKDSGLMVDFLPQGGLLLLSFALPRAAVFKRASALVQFAATWE
jgi:hypothetical protein